MIDTVFWGLHAFRAARSTGLERYSINIRVVTSFADARQYQAEKRFCPVGHTKMQLHCNYLMVEMFLALSATSLYQVRWVFLV